MCFWIEGPDMIVIENERVVGCILHRERSTYTDFRFSISSIWAMKSAVRVLV